MPTRSSDIPPIDAVTVQTPGGSTRRLSLLAPAEARAYARAVARVTPAVERRLGPEVLANRAPGIGTLEPWQRARGRWRRAAERLTLGGVVSTLDVAACYDSIRPGTVAASLAGAGATRGAIGDIVRLLERFRDAGVPGIPVGPDPSAILANAVLAAVDAAIRAEEVRFVRWVDDVCLAGDPRRVGRAELAAERALARMGLRLNESKHRRAGGGDEARALVFGASVRSGAGLEILAGP